VSERAPSERERDREPWTVRRVLEWAAADLRTRGSTSPRLDAEVLLAHVLGVNRVRLVIDAAQPLAQDELGRYRGLHQRRRAGEPVAYLVGMREFYGRPFRVDARVLVPRPETELLVAWAVSWLRQRDQQRVTAVDVGTGSGAIAIATAAQMDPRWPGRIVASDVSLDAISFAARNRARLDTHHRVALVQGSLTSWLRGPVDLILANLPYLRPEQIGENDSLAAEPRMALDGGADGTDLIRLLLADAPRVLASGGAIALEIDPSHRDDVVAMARRTFPVSEMQVLPDLAGFDRHVIIQTKSG
jgi:release factor glutamine methyltransferase